MPIHQFARAKHELVMPSIGPAPELPLPMNQIDRVRIGEVVRVKEAAVPPSVKAIPFRFGADKAAHCHDGRTMAVGFIDIGGPDHCRADIARAAVWATLADKKRRFSRLTRAV